MTIYPNTETMLDILDFYAKRVTNTGSKHNKIKYIQRNVEGNKISKEKATSLKPLPTPNLNLERLTIKSIGYTAKAKFEYSVDVLKKNKTKRYTFIHKTTFERSFKSGKIVKIRDTIEKIFNPTPKQANAMSLKVALNFFRYIFSNRFDKFSNLFSPSSSQKWINHYGWFEDKHVFTSGMETPLIYKNDFFNESKNFDIQRINFKLIGPHAILNCNLNEYNLENNKKYNLINAYKLYLNSSNKIEKILSRTHKNRIGNTVLTDLQSLNPKALAPPITKF